MIPPYSGPSISKNVNIEIGNDERYQLYNLKEDISQIKNLAKTETEQLELLTRFRVIRNEKSNNKL